MARFNDQLNASQPNRITRKHNNNDEADEKPIVEDVEILDAESVDSAPVVVTSSPVSEQDAVQKETSNDNDSPSAVSEIDNAD